jgi:hypothetical protein
MEAELDFALPLVLVSEPSGGSPGSQSDNDFPTRTHN